MTKDWVRPLFSETQYFRQRWLWLLILGIAVLTIWATVQQIFFGESFGSKPVPDVAVMVITAIFGFGFPAVFYKMNLTTKVGVDGIYYRFFPFHLSIQKITVEDIIECEVQDYSPIKGLRRLGHPLLP